jgi:hypothetical protein
VCEINYTVSLRSAMAVNVLWKLLTIQNFFDTRIIEDFYGKVPYKKVAILYIVNSVIILYYFRKQMLFPKALNRVPYLTLPLCTS